MNDGPKYRNMIAINNQRIVKLQRILKRLENLGNEMFYMDLVRAASLIESVIAELKRMNQKLEELTK